MRARKALLLAVLSIFIYIGIAIGHHTISVVKEESLLPRWDEAAHALDGWFTYYYLKKFDLPMFVWHLWTRGTWPFVNPLYTGLFYFVGGPTYLSALIGNVVAFIFIGMMSSYLLIIVNRNIPVLAITVMIFFLFTSPMYLAYSSLSMMEIFGSLIQLIVFITYYLSRFKETANKERYGKIFAISLTILFFTKFNYFLMLALPIVIYEYIMATKKWNYRYHFKFWKKAGKWLISSLLGRIFIIYCVFISAVMITGGFEFRILGRDVSMRTPGASGYIFLYALLIKFWFQHRKGVIPWNRLFKLDCRIRLLIVFFAIPVLVWFAVPYPNHMVEFFGFLVPAGRAEGGLSFFPGILHYVKLIETEYFSEKIVFILGIAIYGVGIIRFKKQQDFTKWLILVSLTQVFCTALHPYKQARFVFLALIPIWFIIAMESEYWIGLLNMRRKFISIILSAAVFYLGFSSFKNIIQSEPFRRIALGSYTRNAQLNQAFDWLRGNVRRQDRLAILGKSDALSPALFEWQVGRPRRYFDFIGSIDPDKFYKLNKATHICLIIPTTDRSDPEILQSFKAHSSKMQSLLESNRIEFLNEFPLKNMKLVLCLYCTINH